MIGAPASADSCSRTVVLITVSNTRRLGMERRSCIMSRENRVRGTTNVPSRPSTRRRGFSRSRASCRVRRVSLSPLIAYPDICTGMTMKSVAASTLTVWKPKLGGVS